VAEPARQFKDGIDVDIDDDAATRRATAIAPAKLNLMLAVGARRADGFHEVVSIMQTLDLSDRVDVDVDLWDSELDDVLVEAPDVPGGDTLVTRAVEELLLRAGVHARVWVTIEKEIPIGGGLGGGSSNAAAALRAVNMLLPNPVPPDALVDIAAGIGSDVPFFLLGPGSTALATGRGERIQRAADLPGRPWLLVNPNVQQSTAQVYAEFDPGAVDPLPVLAPDSNLSEAAATHRNDLARPARAVNSAIDRVMCALEDAGGEPLLCGSGATIAVPIETDEGRRALEAVARNAAPDCWLRMVWTTPRIAR
jgi:4-diphosphocytidyl-2-C-methyl-D-erythritol kinase